MDEMTLRRAMEPFFTTKEQGRGTGLGLSTVHGFAVQSGGAMRMSSRTGIGTNVALWFPTTNAARTDQPGPALAPVEGRKTRSFRVLVVDDDPLVGAGTVAMIEDLGHVAIDAELGARALEILRSEPNIDVVITDYAMPGMNGGQLAAEINRVWPRIPVIIATGYADVLDNGLDLRLLQKPYQQRDLADLLETFIEPPSNL